MKNKINLGSSLEKSIDDVNFSEQNIIALKKLGIWNLGDLIEKTELDLLATFTPRSIANIQRVLAQHSLSLKVDKTLEEEKKELNKAIKNFEKIEFTIRMQRKECENIREHYQNNTNDLVRALDNATRANNKIYEVITRLSELNLLIAALDGKIIPLDVRIHKLEMALQKKED